MVNQLISQVANQECKPHWVVTAFSGELLKVRAVQGLVQSFSGCVCMCWTREDSRCDNAVQKSVLLYNQ